MTWLAIQVPTGRTQLLKSVPKRKESKRNGNERNEKENSGKKRKGKIKFMNILVAYHFTDIIFRVNQIYYIKNMLLFFLSAFSKALFHFIIHSPLYFSHS